MKIIRGNNRRGAILITALVCLMVISLLSSTLLRQGFLARGQVRAEERRLQARWLADSGLERAAARLLNDAKYSGETWTVSADELGGAWPGLVTIVVAPVESHPKKRLVRVQADYPNEATVRVRQRVQTMIELSSVTSGETQ
jgi:Tfp pilus assembly protein PilX